MQGRKSHCKAWHSKARQGKARQDEARQGKIRQVKASHCKSRAGQATQNKTRQGQLAKTLSDDAMQGRTVTQRKSGLFRKNSRKISELKPDNFVRVNYFLNEIQKSIWT